MKIKIRAWNKRNKIMYKVRQILFLSDTDIRIFGIPFDSRKGKELVNCSIDHVELIHYTGQPDKDKNEVFENDIIEFDEKSFPFYPHLRDKYLVIWDNENSRFVAENTKYIKEGTIQVIEANNFKHGTIVGNKYENPELL